MKVYAGGRLGRGAAGHVGGDDARPEGAGDEEHEGEDHRRRDAASAVHAPIVAQELAVASFCSCHRCTSCDGARSVIRWFQWSNLTTAGWVPPVTTSTG